MHFILYDCFIKTFLFSEDVDYFYEVIFSELL
jgi:hypothetical protein